MAVRRVLPQWRHILLLLSLLTLAECENQVKKSKSRTQTRLEMSTEFFIVPSKNQRATTPTTYSSTNAAAAVVVSRKDCDGHLCSPPFKNRTMNPSYTSLNPGSFLREEGWVIPLMIFSTLTMLVIAGFEVFVLCKALRTIPSRRHLFLGQMLLLGLFLCAGLGAVVTMTPSVATCATVRFGAGLAFALVFSTLLVKNVFLISLNGGVYLPATYQALLLLFAVLIQLVAGIQWLVNSPPRTDSLKIEDSPSSYHRRRLVVTADDLLVDVSPTIPICHASYSEVLLSLAYVVFLIIFVSVLAIKSRGIRDNYREATYIGLSVGCVIPLWMIWSVTGLVLSERHKDACIGFGLVSTSAVVFLIMFMPKGRQLAAMGKDGVYVEDREDRFSSLTPAGSGYSPSFFHFKPVKYGVVGDNLMPTSTAQKTNPSAINTIGGLDAGQSDITQNRTLRTVPTSEEVRPEEKRQLVYHSVDKRFLAKGLNSTLFSDRMTLVAAPPSYTRMYHYYPPTPAPFYPSFYPPRYPDMYLQSDDGKMYSSQEPTLSSNPNVFFQRNELHPGLMY